MSTKFLLFKALDLARCGIFIPTARYNRIGATLGKRGAVLSKLVENKDRRKKWHLDVMTRPEKCKDIFKKVYKPTKRIAVLNTLFIENITDILSTGDVVPEIMGSGIEITGVKVSPDYQIVNVYWQIPPSTDNNSADLQKLLSKGARKIRAELIGRNVLGRVPHIYFVQDQTNEKLIEFQKALESIDIGPEDQLAAVPDQGFLKDLLVFKEAREEKQKKLMEAKEKVNDDEPEAEKAKPEKIKMPKNPGNMRCDVLGVNHTLLMDKVMSSKKRTNQDILQTPIRTQESGDLLSKLPAEPLYSDEEYREKLLKQFYVNRKQQMKQKQRHMMEEEERPAMYFQESDASDNLEHYEPDYLDENEEEEENM